MFIPSRSVNNVASIVLSQNPDQETFHENSPVTGSLDIELSKLNEPVAKIIVELRYSEEILCKSTDRNKSKFRLQRNVDLDSFNASDDVCLDLNGRLAENTNLERQFKIPFALKFPQKFPQRRTDVPLHSFLPPSFGAYTPQGPAARLAAEIVTDSLLRISYWLEVRITAPRPKSLNDKTLFYGFVPLKFLPLRSSRLIKETVLPDETTDGTYSIQTTLFRSRLFSKKEYGELDAKIENFRQIVAFAGAHESVDIKLVPKLALKTSSNAVTQSPKLKSITCAILAFSITSQRVCNDLLKADEGSSTVYTHRDKYPVASKTVSQTQWKQQDGMRTLEVTLVVTLDYKAIFTPTYFTHMSSRQYKLLVELHFSDNAKTIALHLPLKIVAQASKKV